MEARVEGSSRGARLDFGSLTGKRVRVAVVDSGLCPRWNRMKIAGGVNLTGVGPEDDYRDEIGHGTACAGIIARKAPEAELYVVKIFTDEIVSNVDRLVRAIDWCVEKRVDVVNLSAGTTDDSARELVQAACERATIAGVVVVAAVDNDGLETYPASFPGVLGVAAGKVRGRYDYYFDPEERIQAIGRGDQQRVDGLGGKSTLGGGSSSAAAHVSGTVALLLEVHPGLQPAALEELLVAYSLPVHPALAEGQGALVRSASKEVRLRDVCGQSPVDWIGRAVLFPYNKEMHSLVRFAELLPFEVCGVVDVVGTGRVGEDTGEAIGAARSGMTVSKDLVGTLEAANTLVLGPLNELSRIRRRDILAECLELALKQRKNVFSLTAVTDGYEGVVRRFEEGGLRLEWPCINVEHYEAISAAFDWRDPSRVPAVGVFGTSAQQGKFTAQLALRAGLQAEGYGVGQLGTEHQSGLFGFDYTFPNGYDGLSSIQLPLQYHIGLLQSVMVGIERGEPDIIVVGAQSGLVPSGYAQKSQQYTLASVILLMGTAPDVYVLVVNHDDEEELIEEHLQALRILGKGKPVLLVYSDKAREVTLRLGRPLITQRQLSTPDMESTRERLESRFGLPATEIVTADGRERMVKAVLEHFYLRSG